MPSVTVADQCPRWCSGDHPAATYGRAFYHASELASVTLSQAGALARPGGLAEPGCTTSNPDRLDVQTVQYLPEDPAEPTWPPAVEIAVHSGGRYRLIGLTPEQARQLAGLLAKAADIVDAPSVDCSEESK